MTHALQRIVSLAFVSAIVGASVLGSGCTDPVRDDEIDSLGPEDPAVPQGPEHRPGQPCVHCHSTGGPAANKPFAIAGTVYETSKPNSKGADQITVQFVDARGSGPLQTPETGPSGNFFVPLQDWPNLAFPIRVGLYKDINGEPVQVMKSLINREAACNFCHRPNLDNPNEAEINDSKSSAGQIYLETGP